MTIAWAIIIVAVLVLLERHSQLTKAVRIALIVAAVLTLGVVGLLVSNRISRKWNDYQAYRFAKNHDCFDPSTQQVHPVGISSPYCDISNGEQLHVRGTPLPPSPTLLISCDLSCDWKLDSKPQGRIAENQSTVVGLILGDHLVVAESTDGIAHFEKTIEVSTAAQTTLKVKLASLHSAQLSQYYAVYENQDVILLRKVFNDYLHGRNDNESEYELLSQWDRSYYQSKFIVLSIENGLAGGVWITVIFQDHPDRVFNAWVFNHGELRAFDSPGRSDQDMENLRSEFRQFLDDKEHAL
jgi:hypothetical protein